ncbi:hypothetical protein IE53DRAFT_383574 [Violaceomyces palustris]|uniref:Uncharacterized protein n=1 Tax=Violaceomyces palustris TaxID=1673888 RepID=A0ACD0P6Z5_9BASI|nr:hypothetical protein IE53DRAFT_383574 [Violaceomyces palustris]
MNVSDAVAASRLGYSKGAHVELVVDSELIWASFGIMFLPSALGSPLPPVSCPLSPASSTPPTVTPSQPLPSSPFPSLTLDLLHLSVRSRPCNDMPLGCINATE